MMPADQPRRERYASLTVPSRVEFIRLAADFIVQAARTMDVAAAGDSLFEVAIVEALNNALQHGSLTDRGRGSIVCELELVANRLVVRVLDEGEGFVPPAAGAPDWNPDDRAAIPESGYGLSIIRDVFTTVRTIARPGHFGLEMAL